MNPLPGRESTLRLSYRSEDQAPTAPLFSLFSSSLLSVPAQGQAKARQGKDGKQGDLTHIKAPYLPEAPQMDL